jgi:hypothetical protein
MSDRDDWLSEIFKLEGIHLRYGSITTADLRAHLKKKWGRSPSNIGTIDALEAIAFALEHPDGVERELRFPKKKIRDPKKSAMYQLKRKISAGAILGLRQEGMTYQSIANIAGISRERVRQICKANSPPSSPDPQSHARSSSPE